MSDSVLLLFGGNVSRGHRVCFALTIYFLKIHFFAKVLVFIVFNQFISTGWTFENVRRLSRVLHETRFSRNVFEVKKGTR